MRFQFDGNQPYQLRAIESVADLFRGQPRVTLDFTTLAFGQLFSPVANRLDLDEAQLLANVIRQSTDRLPHHERQGTAAVVRGAGRVPNWGLVMEQVDEHGDAGPLLYLIRETKGTTEAGERRGVENQKIHCGARHFQDALGVDYKVVTSADELP